METEKKNSVKLCHRSLVFKIIKMKISSSFIFPALYWPKKRFSIKNPSFMCDRSKATFQPRSNSTTKWPDPHRHHLAVITTPSASVWEISFALPLVKFPFIIHWTSCFPPHRLSKGAGIRQLNGKKVAMTSNYWRNWMWGLELRRPFLSCRRRKGKAEWAGDYTK